MKMHPSSVVVDSYQDVVHGQEDNAFISFFLLLLFFHLALVAQDRTFVKVLICFQI